MTRKDNTINLPGYLSKIAYGDNQGADYITQHVAQFSAKGKEIAFYNEHKYDVLTCLHTLVAIWHIKERKQLP